MKILVIEDERKVSAFIKKGLEENNYEVTVAYDGPDGQHKALSENFNLILLDLNLPLLNGIEVCKQIRLLKNTPILMLTALGDLENKVAGLDAGADDYLLKPFEFQELLARIRALSRRTSDSAETIIYKIADIELYPLTRTVIRAGQVIELTAKEFGLLEYFLKNKGKVLSRADIAENVWDLHFDTGTNIVDVYINYLRKKIDRDFSVKLIHTLIGRGYILKEENTQDANS
jgi:two-component system copper resistance phosphate regulon response regulator CusR